MRPQHQDDQVEELQDQVGHPFAGLRDTGSVLRAAEFLFEESLVVVRIEDRLVLVGPQLDIPFPYGLHTFQVVAPLADSGNKECQP